MKTETANKARYAASRGLLSVTASSGSERDSGLTKTIQQSTMASTENANGGSIISINSPVGILNFPYRYKFCGLPNGVSMPPRFAAIFCMINVNGIYFCFPVEESAR